MFCLKPTRREFLAGAAALPLALRSMAQATAAASAPKFILAGTLDGPGISRVAWNPATGELGTFELAAATRSPTYLAMHPRLPILYAVNELGQGDGTISSFAVQRERGGLLQLNSIGIKGNAPTYITISAGADGHGAAAFVANYGGGTIVCAPLTEQGDFLPVSAPFGNPQTQHGPVAARQEAAHMHCTVVSPDGDFVLACDLGNDAILVFRILRGPGGSSAQATALSQATLVATRAGAGPRHLRFHPNGRWLYCIDELDCTLELYDWNAGDATLVARHGSVVSTLAARDHLKGSTACEVQISPDGRFLYANTRGEDSLVVYRVDSRTGLLKQQQRLAAGGHATRYFTFDPTRRWLLSANQGSNTIGVFAHDPVTGRITPSPRLYDAPTPMFLLFT